MATIDTALQQVVQDQSQTSQRRRHRRGGPHRARPRADVGTNEQTSTSVNSSLVFRPASVGPPPNSSSAEASSAEVSATDNGPPSRTRGGTPRGGDRGRIRGTGRGGEGRGARIETSGRGQNARPSTQSEGGNLEAVSHNPATIVGSNRRFGGRLTQEGGSSTLSQSVLHADAQEFHPGQVHHPRAGHSRGGRAAQASTHQNNPRTPRPRRQSFLKSTAPDIATRTHEDISNAIYECPICTNEVARNSKVWSYSGGVRGAICLRMFYHLRTHVGARRKSILDQYLVYHLTHVVKHVENREFYQKSAPILANSYVMPGHVLRVHTWGQYRAASAVKIDHLEDALTQTMIPDGAVARYAGISCLVANILARSCAMKVYAVPAKYSSIVAATVVEWNKRLYVCPFLAQKPCMCGKKTLKNQPCWLTEVRCGEVCGNKLRCGSHFCRKQCHRPGDCEDVGRACQQACGKAKKSCGHPCEVQCHAPSVCREDKPCQNKIFITCDCQHLKQEMKCNASKASEGNTKKTLPCDDECARLARNQKLALALNIDPEAHKDDHIPYSNDTLKMFRENVKWAQTQEREFRVFAADDAEKRLRFKPMPGHQRAFIHALSDDFGLDSESMDPEPYRHVAVFKTPRFVMAPMKTLAECVRIRTAAEATTVTVADTQKKLQANNEIYNGFLLTQPRFGLTLEELRADLAPVLDHTPGLAYDISFLPSEKIVIKARPASSSTVLTPSAIESSLKALKNDLSVSIASKRLASSIQLCATDPSLNILRRELDDPANNGGWSQVAAKAAAPRSAPRQTTVGEKSVYTVLGSKLRDAKKKKDEARKAKDAEAAVDDWEEELMREEEEEEKAKAELQGEVQAQAGIEDQHREGVQGDGAAQQIASTEIHDNGDHVASLSEV
ncbi:hypothetical protein JMJ35_001395 [Cladonia borealis]|uniref:R3H domain-containing protein n=1 Tax=Cladonia borealis TaxID=184061 RepID=A0AA39V5E2_9LECA|nr:hypothetical protein JMJ35_001395 [Cladonia borealis]